MWRQDGDKVRFLLQATVEENQVSFGCLRNKNNGCSEMPTNMKRILETEKKKYKPQTVRVGCKVGGRKLVEPNGCTWAVLVVPEPNLNFMDCPHMLNES